MGKNATLLSGDLARRAALGRGQQRSLWEGTFERSQVCLGIIAEDTQTLKKKIAVEPRKNPRSWSGELGGKERDGETRTGKGQLPPAFRPKNSSCDLREGMRGLSMLSTSLGSARGRSPFSWCSAWPAGLQPGDSDPRSGLTLGVVFGPFLPFQQ